MKHTKFLNKLNKRDSNNIINWLQKNYGKKTPLRVTQYNDGTIKELNIGIQLTKADKEKLVKEFSELEGNEV